MPITLKNYAKELSKELILLAEKNTVRECDETVKGHFVAYVDEGSDSFDVALIISPKGEVGKGTCDCEAKTPFCRHKAALLIHLATGKKIKETVKVKKKLSQVDTLLEEAEPVQLKEWIKNLIQKNKDIELAFVHHFSAGKHEYTAEEVTKLVKDSIKATASNKKNIDATQLKKLVDLWADVLKPVVEYYQANVMEEKAFQAFHSVIDACREFEDSISTTSNKIPKYIIGILQSSEAPLHNLQNDDAFDKATSFFVANVPQGTNAIRVPYLAHLENIIKATGSGRREKLINLLALQLKKIDTNLIYDGALYVKAIFDMVEEYNLFPKYYNIFKPIGFDNAFNLKLIGLLIDNNHLALAEKYCRAQIKSNFSDQYSIPYYTVLRNIYAAQKDDANLARVVDVLLPQTFNFDDYLFVLTSLPADAAKSFRSKILSRARNMRSYNNQPAVEFGFLLADYEKTYKKMIGYIDSSTPYKLILKYFEVMVAADKPKLLTEILQKPDGWSSQNIDNDEDCLPEMFEKMVKHYTADYLARIIQQANRGKLYYTENRFFTYAKRMLTVSPKK